LGNDQPYEGEGQGEVAAAEEPPLAPPWQGGELAADNIIVKLWIVDKERQVGYRLVKVKRIYVIPGILSEACPARH
jgi:hypothetical protein